MDHFEVINSEEAAARMIRSYLLTLRRFLNTSMAYHGRCIESTYLLASELLTEVQTLGEAHRGSHLVGSYVNKFTDFVDQHGLIKLPGEGKKHGKAKQDGDTVLSDVRQDRSINTT